jgi:hypothetical protein
VTCFTLEQVVDVHPESSAAAADLAGRAYHPEHVVVSHPGQVLHVLLDAVRMMVGNTATTKRTDLDLALLQVLIRTEC